MLLRDRQTEVPYLQSRWLLGEAAGRSYVTDDVSGVVLPSTGSPTLGLQSMCKGDGNTCASGGATSGTKNGFVESSVDFDFSAGVTLESVTAADPDGGTGPSYLFLATGQAALAVVSNVIEFEVWIGATLHTLSASTLSAWPQIVHGVYDPAAQLQTVYVDGAQAAQVSLMGSVSTSTTGDTEMLTSAYSGNATVQAQDVAVYNGALSAARVLEHFQAFAQVWYDPGHVRSYTPIGVTQ